MSVIADDLTGACDSAVAFAIRGFSTEVLLASISADTPRSDVRAHTTFSRDMASLQLDAHLARAIAALPPSELLFKKIDSVFRGNTFDEIAIMLRQLPDRPALLAPAFPALGRTSRNGVLTAVDVSGVQTIPVAEQLRLRGVDLPVLPAGQTPAALSGMLQNQWNAGKQAVFCDAQTEQHLEDAVCAVQLAERRPLWIGSGGLAHALASNLPAGSFRQQGRSAVRGRTIFFIGSTHPVTQSQVATLRDHCLPAAAQSILIVPVVRGETTPEQIRQAVSATPPESIGCLVMTGGDTAALVCDSLRVRSLQIEREFASGIPEGRVCGGPFDRCPLILKSGGFGDANLLCRIAATFGSPPLPAGQTPCGCQSQLQSNPGEPL